MQNCNYYFTSCNRSLWVLGDCTTGEGQGDSRPEVQGPNGGSEAGADERCPVVLYAIGTDRYSCNSRGAYSLKNPRDGACGRVAYFIDAAEGVDAPLCTVEGCSHSDESCTAFFPMLGDNNILAHDDLLVWISGISWYDPAGTDPLPSDNPEGVPAVWVSDTDGQNRRLVLRLSGQVSIDGALLGQSAQ